MSFDSFRRADPERPRYRFFPNRTRTQTVYLSWSLLGLAGVIGYLFLRNSERSQAELAVFLEGRMQQGEFLSGRNQVMNQNERMQEILFRERRRCLGLPSHVRRPLAIQGEEEEEKKG